MTKFLLVVELINNFFKIGKTIFDKLDEEAIRSWNEKMDRFVKEAPLVQTPEDAIKMARLASDLVSGMRRPKN